MEDEAVLEPITPEERRGLDLLASVLDTVPLSYWKPGDQPARLLDWLYLGDLDEAMDFELLRRKGIGAVVNLINWWELTARLPEVADLSSVYAAQGVDFLEADSEDRLFFDIVGKSWPEAEEFMRKCHQSDQRVLVNCKAGHNRSACVCVCWLVVHEGMSLLKAVEWVLEQRGIILSNHGFRLQLVRLALGLQRLGEPTAEPSRALTSLSSIEEADGVERSELAKKPALGNIIMRKRLSLKYDHNSRDFSQGQSHSVARIPIRKGASLISEDVAEQLSQRTLKMELLVVLYHRGKNFNSDYEYTSSPPTVIGSGFSGDVVLCKPRERTAVRQNSETGVRCVKKFDLGKMGADRLEKLKNEAIIYLSLEHPHIARLFDVYDDDKEASLVMQYCSGGTLEDSLRCRGAYSESEFQRVAVQMLLAVTYIHRMGIVHRDIKPRNWVYEADGATVKLIDFGFSAKAYLSDCGNEKGEVLGCMGTLGYLAPEVVHAGLSTDAAYTEKCDIWSLGAVFFELLAGQPAFHRDRGQCDGYTEEVVLREIEDVTPEGVENLLLAVPSGARAFLQRLLTKDAAVRPSARQVLDDPYLAAARCQLLQPSEALSVATVLERFRAHSRASKTSRAWLLAVARSPTHLPWKDFVALRNTFKMFDARGLSGTVNLETFLSVITDALGEDLGQKRALEEEVRGIWEAICGEQESLSYCEFLAALLPPIEDVFEDVAAPTGPRGTPLIPTFSSDSLSVDCTPRSPWLLNSDFDQKWNPSQPISSYLPVLRLRKGRNKVPIFDEHMTVKDVVQEMSIGRHRWVVVRYDDGRQAFFDYMDINHRLVKIGRKLNGTDGPRTSSVMSRIVCMPVGALANCSGHAAYVPMSSTTPLREILQLIAGREDHGSGEAFAPVRRVPIINKAGEVLHIFSCLDFLDLVLQFAGPTAILKSLSARTFDHRNTILQVSVMNDDSVVNALRIMDSAASTVLPATLRELSGDLGGVVASNVVSVSDLKLVILEERHDVLDLSVSEFISWRQNVISANVDHMLRQQRLQRFNVVSVDAGDSLHTLAHRLLASKLQRLFLSSDEIARIVGIVSSRDILLEVLDQIV